MRLLLIGALPPPLGGTTVLFKQLVDELASVPGVRVTVIDTTRKQTRRFSNAVHALRVFFAMLRVAPQVDVVSFHTSTRGASLFGPLVWGVCRLFRKKWIFRGFGGNFDLSYGQASRLGQWVFRRTVLRADISLFETRASVEYFQKLSTRSVQWYANSRRFVELAAPTRNALIGRGRFLYVGHVKSTKGIHEIIEAGEMINGNIVIDVYGPLVEGMTEADFQGKRVRYCGMLQSVEVIPTIQKYDALLLPTYHEGEGYPGVILEAYSAGVPVIVTRWRSIPEIVDDSSGILIEPKSATQLAQAMQMLMCSPQYLEVLRQGALEMARRFSSQAWTDRFVQLNRTLVEPV